MKSKPLKLSFTKIDTYRTCSEKYRLEYVEYLTKDEISTPLFFGAALDQASSIIFNAKLKENSIPFDRNLMIDTFINCLSVTRHLGEEGVSTPTNTKIRYSKADLDPSLLEPQDEQDIIEYGKELGYNINIVKFIEYCQKYKDLSDDEKSLFNYINFCSMVRKGILLLDKLKEWADENVEYVVSLQTKISVKNGLEDELNGALDLVAKLKGESFERVLDLKTASNAVQQYPDNCVEEAMQLHIYSQEANLPNVGYVVLDKAIRVREPRVRERVLLGEVNDAMLDKTFDIIEEVTDNIKAKVFEKNKDACFAYGRCTFYDLCWKGSKKGLVSKYANQKKTDKKTNS